jgi:ABC-type sugar transport system ATPase subunit
VTVGLRAEDVRIVSEASTSPTAFPAVVRLIEPMGSDTFVELDVGQASVVARVAPDAQLAIDQKVCADVTPGRIHLFNTASGDRILE